MTAPTLEGTPGKPVASSLRWIALGAVSLGVAATILNQTISNVAIPAISKEIGLTTENATWVNAAYALTFASLLLLMGRLADLVGRRKIFITGLLIFSASSIVVALTQTVGQLVAARVAQGIGAAMILPASLSLVNAVFKGRDRAIAFAVWGSTIGIVSAVGPLLG
ncbi:MAG: MFS transporter, partial [Actinobacteria bacterium]|nr:MFS transporter [Actinomycetota bacterium]